MTYSLSVTFIIMEQRGFNVGGENNLTQLQLHSLQLQLFQLQLIIPKRKFVSQVNTEHRLENKHKTLRVSNHYHPIQSSMVFIEELVQKNCPLFILFIV